MKIIYNIFNLIEEIILYNNQINNDDIKEIYTKYINYLDIINSNIDKNIETSNQIKNIVNKLSSSDLNFISTTQLPIGSM